MMTRRTAPALAFAAFAAGGALPAFAQEEAKAGLPQLNIAFFPGQLFWLAIAFTLLYMLMTYVALPGIKRTQDSRRQKLESDLAAAQAANETAKAMMAQYEKALADARAKAQATVSENIAAAAKAAAARSAEQQHDIARHLAAAEARIAHARDAAIKSISDSAEELAAAVVEKVSGLSLKAGG